MSDPAPRRRRPQTPPPARSGSPLPWIALVIGVIVAGLGIGALISAYQNRGVPAPELSPGIPAVTPVPQETQGPTPVPEASPSPTPAPTATPVPKRTPSPHPTATPAPTPTPSPTATPAETPTPSPVPSPTAAPPTAAPPTAAPTLVPTPKPTPVPTVAPPPPPPASDAASVVRRYLDALIGGDTGAASALLAPGGTLKEAAFLDPSARVTSARVTHSDAAGASVQAEISAARGTYLATFRVGAGGVIESHDYIKE